MPLTRRPKKDERMRRSKLRGFRRLDKLWKSSKLSSNVNFTKLKSGARPIKSGVIPG